MWRSCFALRSLWLLLSLSAPDIGMALYEMPSAATLAGTAEPACVSQPPAARVADAVGTVKHFAARAASQAMTRWAGCAMTCRYAAAVLGPSCSSLQPANYSPLTVVSLVCYSYENVAMSFKESTSQYVRQEVSIESPSTSQTVQVIRQEVGQGPAVQ